MTAANQDDQQRIDAISSATSAWIATVHAHWTAVSDKDTAIRNSLQDPEKRNAALRVILLLGTNFTARFFDALVDLSATGHSDIDLCRLAIKSLPRHWTRDRIKPLVEKLTQESTDDEVFSRLLELLREIDDGLLEYLRRKAASNSNPHVRDLAE